MPGMLVFKQYCPDSTKCQKGKQNVGGFDWILHKCLLTFLYARSHCDWLHQYQPSLTLAHMLPVLYTIFRMRMNGSLYRYFHQSRICLQFGVGIHAVPTADAGATGEVSCYNFIVRLLSVALFAETVTHG